MFKYKIMHRKHYVYYDHEWHTFESSHDAWDFIFRTAGIGV